MSRNLFRINLNGNAVLDMGCGTAVLAILAKKLGAGRVLGIDIDEWSIENGKENCEINNTNTIELQLGDAHLLGKEHFDVILANINRNILLNDIHLYAACLKEGGELYLSGFFESDFETLKNAAVLNKLICIVQETKNEWGLLGFKKN
jgi:ribosomal protein L11 methyltransferase